MAKSEAPRPAVPAPVAVAKVSAIVSETVTQSRESETPQVVVAMAAQVTVEKESEMNRPTGSKAYSCG